MPGKNARVFAQALPLLAALGTASYATVAEAGPNDNSASYPWSLQAGLGPMVDLLDADIRGRFSIDMEYHFKGGDVGPALGFYTPMHFDPFEFGMNLGPAFVWDFRVGQVSHAKFYVGPFAATGYGFEVFDGDHFWFFHLGPQLRVLWKDRIGLFVRPAGFDIWVGTVLTGNWTFVTGLAAAF